MGPIDKQITVPERARVSIIGRLVPGVSFALVAISGIAGSVMILQFFKRLRGDERAGFKDVMAGLASIDETVGLVIAAGSVIGIIWIVVWTMRLSAAENEAALPGVLYFGAGLPCLAAPMLTAYVSWVVITAFSTPGKKDLGQVGALVAELSIVAIIAGAFALAVLLAFSFLPFTARLGKKYSPIIFTVFIEIGIVSLAAACFWLVGLARQATNPFAIP